MALQSVVQSCNWLLAALMKRQPGMSGILYWAVGEEALTWDTLMPSPNSDDQQLVNEIARKALTAERFLYLDENNEAVEGPTARLQISATFTREELGGQGAQSLREFGLFGGDATETANSGWMIDYVIHPRTPLSAGMILTRNLHLTFGIGAAAPGNSLHVKRTDGNFISKFETSLVNGNAWIAIQNDAQTYMLGIRGDISDNFTIYDNNGGGDRFVIDTNGNVGIGTTLQAVETSTDRRVLDLEIHHGRTTCKTPWRAEG